LGLLLVAGVFVAYLPAMHGGFLWDDDVYVIQNILLTAPDGLKRIWFSFDSPSQYFPLTYTTFRLERSLWGLNPLGYHWVNLLLHTANALLVWRLLQRLKLPGAWLAAAIFALHPVQVESVAWITERKNVLSLFFYLLSLLSWVSFLQESAGRGWRHYGLTLLFYALALFSKTTACTLPAALLLILWLKGNPINWRRLIQVIPFLALGLGMGLLTVWWERYHQGTQGKQFSLSWLERLLVASHAVWFYAGKLFWPVKLTFSYPRWTIDPANPLAYGWLAAGVGLGVAVGYARRFWGRGLEVAILFFVATLSPLLGFVMLFTFRYTFVADHYQYVASLGLMALAAGGLTVALGFWEKKTPWLKPVLCGGLLGLLGLLTWRQAGTYADLVTLWQTTIARNPDCWMAHDNLGNELAQKDRLDEAISHFQEAIRLKPDLAEAYNNLGNALGRKGQIDAAIDQYQQAIRLKPDYAEAYNNLGAAFDKKGLIDAAIDQYQQAIRLKPLLAAAYFDLGNALGRKGQIDAAIDQYQQAIRLKPDYAEAYNNLGAAFDRKGLIDAAIDQYQETVRLKPDDAEAHYNLGAAFDRKGLIDAAISQYQETIRLKPDDAEARSNLARVLGQKNAPANQ